MWERIVFSLVTFALALASGFLARRLAVERRARGRLEEEASRLRALADTDPMTGLRNRRGLEQHVLPMVGRALRQGGQHVCALSVDLNNLKQVNDVHGHEAGDAYIRALADAARRCFIRVEDVVARVGGDEFVVVFSCRDVVDAERAMLRFDAEVRAQSISVGGSVIPLCASIGSSVLTVRSRIPTDPAIPRLAKVPTNPTMARLVLEQQHTRGLIISGGSEARSGSSGSAIRALIAQHLALADSYMYAAKRSVKEDGVPILIMDGIIVGNA